MPRVAPSLHASCAAPGYVQANLVMLPRDAAFDFLLFCGPNPKPCPFLDVLEPGQWAPGIAPDANLRTDLPRYRFCRNGKLEEEGEDMPGIFHVKMIVSSCGVVSPFKVSFRRLESVLETWMKERIYLCKLQTGSAGLPVLFLLGWWSA